MILFGEVVPTSPNHALCKIFLVKLAVDREGGGGAFSCRDDRELHAARRIPRRIEPRHVGALVAARLDDTFLGQLATEFLDERRGLALAEGVEQGLALDRIAVLEPDAAQPVVPF